jgi:putative aldouronate transport system permease protein
MYGVQIAFKNYMATKGIWNSPWIGLDHFKRFFDSYYFWDLIWNTLGLSLYQLVVGFPIPILLALMLNEVAGKKFKKTVQTVTYAPHFISVVVLVGMVVMFLSPQTGIVNRLITLFGGEPIYFMGDASMFKSIYVFSGVWQHMGWGSIIYMAALANVDPHLHEAAVMDGATRMQRIRHINLPAIIPTAIILFILDIGTIMNVGFEKVFLMQNDLNRVGSDVISTFVYRSGILGAEYGFSTAVGLFNSIINFALLVAVNAIARKTSETSLW